MAVTASISLVENSYSTADNTSSVTCKVTVSWTLGSWDHAGRLKTLVFDGTTYTNTDDINPNQTTSGSQTLFNVTKTVAHNADGSKTVSANVTVVTGTSSGTVTASESLTLTKIPRNPSAPTAFSITAGFGNYVGLGDKITLKWSGSSGVITGYELQYSRGNSGWKALKTVTSTATSGSTTDSFTTTTITTTGAGKAIQYRIRALNGTLTSGWKTSNTLKMLGEMDVKVNGTWNTGSTWIKVNGTWKRAKRVWIKVNGTWKYSI